MVSHIQSLITDINGRYPGLDTCVCKGQFPRPGTAGLSRSGTLDNRYWAGNRYCVVYLLTNRITALYVLSLVLTGWVG